MKTLKYLCLALAIIVFASCKKPSAPSITLRDINNVAVGSITLKSSDYFENNYTVETSGSWSSAFDKPEIASITPDSGTDNTKVTIKIAANTSAERTIILGITNGVSAKTIEIKQAGKNQ